MMARIKPQLSIIIPVSDDAGIVECVQSLVPSDGLAVEVIVVLNGATGAFTSTVKYRLEVYDWVRIVEMKDRSIPGARNLGVSKAQTSKILMFDSDCRPEVSGYLSSVSESLDEAHVVLGPVRFRSLSDNRLSSGYAALRQLDYDLHQLSRLYTPNLAYRSSVVEVVGPYNESLITGEDSEWGFRVLAAGYRVKRIDTTVIHWQRASLRTALQTWFLYGRAKGAQVRRNRICQHSLRRDLVYLTAPLGSYVSKAGGISTTLWLRPALTCSFQIGFLVELLSGRGS